MKIGRITKVPLRKLWVKEDKDFSRWLEEHIDVLGEALGLGLSIEKREESVGPFRVDLFGEDDRGRKVIIENQLEKSDHDHLGKAMSELLGGSWERVDETRSRYEMGQWHDALETFMVCDKDRLTHDTACHILSTHITTEIEHWILRIGGHLSRTVPTEQWAKAFDIAPDDEYMLEAMDGWLGRVLRG